MYRGFAALFVCCSVLASVAAQDAPPVTDLDLQFQKLEDTTVSIRGLETLETVTRGFPTREEVREYIEETLAVSLPDETLTELTAFYVAFDFVPAGTNLREVINELYGQQVAGYYDPDTKEMNVVTISPEPGDTLGLLDEIIYVHEYTHALQDQHFDLAAYLDEVEGSENSDLSLARLSLVEGDATFVMNEFTIEATQDDPLGALLELATSGLQAGNMSLPAGTPDIIGDELLFPYLSGEAFVRALLAEGGLERLNQAYENPPVSTEQIIHPDLYLEGHEPLPLDFTPTPPDNSWTVTSTGVFGEFYLQNYLDTQLSSADANAGAAGWGNGMYAIYTKDGALAWTLSLIWDSEEEQAEFESLFKEFAEQRIGDSIADGCYNPAANEIEAEESICIEGTGDRTVITYGQTGGVARTLFEAAR